MLFIGPAASEWAGRVRESAPGAEVEEARLPAAGVRSFEQTPPDVVLLCGPAATARLGAVLEAVRGRPMGGLVPIVVVSDAVIEDADANVASDSGTGALIATVMDLLGVEPAELERHGSPPVRPPTSAPQQVPARVEVTEGVIEQKLREVRHETYFAVLEVHPDADAQELREAFARQSERYGREAISADLSRRFQDELAEVRDGLEDAYAVLSNERLRTAYAASRARS